MDNNLKEVNKAIVDEGTKDAKNAAAGIGFSALLGMAAWLIFILVLIAYYN